MTDPSFSDTFDRSSELGVAWTPTTSGDNMRWSGVGFATDYQTISIAIPDQIAEFDWHPRVELHGRSGAERPNVGAVIDHTTGCYQCGRPFLKGHCITAELAPNMSGIARHTDCDDPKLEKPVDE